MTDKEIRRVANMSMEDLLEWFEDRFNELPYEHQKRLCNVMARISQSRK